MTDQSDNAETIGAADAAIVSGLTAHYAALVAATHYRSVRGLTGIDSARRARAVEDASAQTLGQGGDPDLVRQVFSIIGSDDSQSPDARLVLRHAQHDFIPALR